MVSTVRDSGDGNSIGDARKASKTINANDNAFYPEMRLAA